MTGAPITIARQGSFFVTGEYRPRAGEHAMTGQMYVEFQIPAGEVHPYPIVMMHGGGQTGANFHATPDGRPGWADHFLASGYAVYIVDQVGRGRSGLVPDFHASIGCHPADYLQGRFTATEKYDLWPQASLHTQWPGETGQIGDVDFDQYYASTVPFIADYAIAEEVNVAAFTRLLDRIGPAIVLTHSQAGANGWRIGDARPHLVKSIVAVEPMGPPFHEIDFVGPPDYLSESKTIARPYGISRGTLTYSPPVASPTELARARQPKPDRPGLVAGWGQAEPARQLVNLQGISILIITGEASYHAPYDHATADFLTQAGVPNTHIRLEDAGLRGNGHMMFLEKNSREIAMLIMDWLGQHVPRPK